MAQIVFHVGMGKTGSTTIQRVLQKNPGALAAAGYDYLGTWQGLIKPEFNEFEGFQSFLRQTPDQLIASAEALVAAIGRIGDETGVQKFILSNEQYLENVARLADFFKIIAAKADLQIIIFVRSPARWLPSAYIQWGVAHKTNPGPVRPFATKARELMRQYEFVRQWRELFGSAVTVLTFDDSVDVVQDFAEVLGLTLPAETARQQTRPPIAETLLRAACNTSQQSMVLPDLFNTIRAQYLPPGTPARLSQKFEHIFNVDTIPAILAEHRETLSYIERECAITMTGPIPAAPQYDLADLTDELLGTLVSMVFGQAHEIRELRTRLDKLEQTAAGLEVRQ